MSKERTIKDFLFLFQIDMRIFIISTKFQNVIQIFCRQTICAVCTVDVDIKTDGTNFQEKINEFFGSIERNVKLVPAIRFICLRNVWRGRALLWQTDWYR